MECWISDIPLVAIASVSGVKNVVNDLERETNAIAKSGNVLQFRVRGRRQIGSDPNRYADQRPSLRSMDSLKLVRRYRHTFKPQVQNLTGDHPRGRPCSMPQRRDRLEQTVRRKPFTLCDHLKRERQQRIAGEDCHRFTELFMARGLPTPEVIVVHSRQVIMDKRIRMNHLNGGRDRDDRLPVFVPDRICGGAEARPYTLAAS